MAAAITLTAELGKRQVVIQTYMERDAPIQDFHRLLDKLNETVDRQQAKFQLEAEQLQLEHEEKELKRLIEQHDSIEANARAEFAGRGKRGEFKLTSQQEGQKNQAVANINRLKEHIPWRKAGIAKLEAIVGVPLDDTY